MPIVISLCALALLAASAGFALLPSYNGAAIAWLCASAETASSTSQENTAGARLDAVATGSASAESANGAGQSVYLGDLDPLPIAEFRTGIDRNEFDSYR